MGIFSFLNKKDNTTASNKTVIDFPWEPLNDVSQLEEILKDSFTTPQVLFKHSTRCSISEMALKRFEREAQELLPLAKIYYLDLIIFRPVSNAIAEKFDVIHQSPQAIVIDKGEVIYNASHSAISALKIIENLK